MQTPTAAPSDDVAVPQATFDQYLERQLLDPAFRASFEDAQQKHRIIDSLVRLRRSTRVSQKRLADRMGVGQSTVSGFETEDSDPRLSTLQRYARGVGAELRVVISVSTACDWIESARSVYCEADPTLRAGSVCKMDTASRWDRREGGKAA